MTHFVHTPKPPKRGDTLMVHGKPCIVFHAGDVDGEQRAMVIRRAEDGRLHVLSGIVRPERTRFV